MCEYEEMTEAKRAAAIASIVPDIIYEEFSKHFEWFCDELVEAVKEHHAKQSAAFYPCI